MSKGFGIRLWQGEEKRFVRLERTCDAGTNTLVVSVTKGQPKIMVLCQVGEPRNYRAEVSMAELEIAWNDICRGFDYASPNFDKVWDYLTHRDDATQ